MSRKIATPGAAVVSEDSTLEESSRPPELLTARQRQVLDGITRGNTNREIAIVMGLSEKTVKAYVTSIFKALNVKNRTTAALVANGGRQPAHCATCTCNASP